MPGTGWMEPNMVRYYIKPITDTVFCQINAPPQIDVPPQKCLDHVPEVSSPDLPVNAVLRSIKCCINELFVAAYEIIQMYMKNSAVSQLITVPGPKSQVAILFQ